jgi:hypothetical protein
MRLRDDTCDVRFQPGVSGAGLAPFADVVVRHGGRIEVLCGRLVGPGFSAAVWTATFLCALRECPVLMKGTDVESWLSGTAVSMARADVGS